MNGPGGYSGLQSSQPSEAEIEKLQLNKVLQASAEMDRNLKRQVELQFLDDLKRLILEAGSHNVELGPQPIDEQITVSSDPSQKIIRKKPEMQMPNRLKFMRAALMDDADDVKEEEELQIAAAIRESIRTAQMEHTMRDGDDLDGGMGAHGQRYQQRMPSSGNQGQGGGGGRVRDAFFA
mmetsp:Transcript_34821/g.79426  ORF Transcript_34821/g.79426 Transcript_34821/m.79426 type:complete len:179 (-) Transcript_34821:73-609(-)